jgi:GYF domain 2
MAQWHYRSADGRSVGPLSSAELKALADSGRVTSSTPIRQSTGQRWVPASQVNGLFPQEPRTVAERADPALQSQLPRPDVAPAPPTAPSGNVAPRRAGIPLTGWATISVLGSIAVAAIALLVIVLLRRGEKPPPQRVVVVEKPVGEMPKPASGQVVEPQAAPSGATAQIEKPPAPVEKVAAILPPTPAAKETHEPPPAPRPDEQLANDDARKAQDADKTREAQQRRELDEAQQREAKQLELSRLNERIGAAKSELAAIDEQATALTTKRGDVFAQATVADTAARKVAGQMADLQVQVKQLNTAISAANQRTMSQRDYQDLLNRRQLAMTQYASLKDKYAGLQATYTGLDASARELKAQLDSLLANRAKSSYEFRCLQIQYEQLLHGPSPGSARDAAAAKAWQQVKRGMRASEVESLLGKPDRKESDRGGQLWSYKYLETGTTVGIEGNVFFVTGKVVTWEKPPWATGS